jgi:hypothetical protein
MTTDRELIREVRRLAECEKLVTAPERETILDKITDYENACRISRGPDPRRRARWSNVAFERGRELQRWFQAITGKEWIDMTAIPKKSHKYT